MVDRRHGAKTAGLNLVYLGDPVLRERAADVEAVDDEVRDLARRMFEAMYAWGGQGLAAPQAGISRRIAVADVPPQGRTRYTLINPSVIEASSLTARGVEGCLSIPGMRAVVPRPARVIVEALDERGRPLRLEAEGELARCFQHEIDHLNGRLYIDHLSALSRTMLLRRYHKLTG